MNYSVFDKLLDPVLIVDKEKSIVYCNNAFAQMIGVSVKRLKAGRPSYDYLKFDDKDIFCMPGGKWGEKEETLYREFSFVTKKGNKGMASVCVKPLDDDGIDHWILFMRDMSLEIQLQKKYRFELEQKEEVILDLKKAQIELQQYSKNLEKMVEERTFELKKSNQFINTMINSLGQGLLVFDQDNNCLPIYTKACDEMFKISPQNNSIWKVLDLNEKEKLKFEKWSESIFMEVLPFDDLVGLGPSSVVNFKGRNIGLEYQPFYSDEKLKGIVVVATDKTDEQEAKKEAQENSEYASMIVKMVRNKNQFLSFVFDARKLVANLINLTAQDKGLESIDEILLYLHSIKGGAGVYSIKEIYDLAHVYENNFSQLKDLDEIDYKKNLPTFHHEMINLKNKLEEYFEKNKALLGDAIVDGQPRVEIKKNELEKFSKRIQAEEDKGVLYGDFVHTFVKEDFRSQLNGYSDLIIDVASDHQKKADPINFKGKNIKINSRYYSELFMTLVHAFTNAIVHGLEPVQERISKGKPEAGSIDVSFTPYYKGGDKWMKIIIEDDGQGINPIKIQEKLVSNGASVKDYENQTSHELIQHIFDTSFSTAESITQVSGRGVGMSAIKDIVSKMSGKIEVDSIYGLGSKVIIDVPDL